MSSTPLCAFLNSTVNSFRYRKAMLANWNDHIELTGSPKRLNVSCKDEVGKDYSGQRSYIWTIQSCRLQFRYKDEHGKALF
jgi:hypothetical protein